MPGWNGAGIYDLRYTFVNDAAASIPILASRQDSMWNDVKNGFQNCYTLDSQTTPTTNLNMGGFRVTNIAAGVANTDAARVDQVIAGEWVIEAHAASWISASSFKLLGADLTAIYHAGRRVKFLDNGVQVYGTVVSSSFSTDTTLSLVMDGYYTLVGPITVPYYGLESYVYPSYLSPISAFQVSSGGVLIANTTETQIVWTGSENLDVLNEFNSFGNYSFYPLYPGYYVFSMTIDAIIAALGLCYIKFRKNGVYYNGVLTVGYAPASFLSVPMSLSAIMSLTNGDYVDATVQFSTANAGNGYGSGSNFSGHRIR